MHHYLDPMYVVQEIQLEFLMQNLRLKVSLQVFFNHFCFVLIDNLF